ncbi:hypothetical protein L873DRAFT_593518 [Choiromyces venosus 120613-1]|uniref:Uncharacterized protein n=1 Tax=Choiromyces venosus 120613-1 TaxID=1336337 RepID=A0A3N4IXM2_9PEZI|nr:hypothetical protein L873DRAFT_593518 [Choiromyces venosus 120613-1]
MEILLLAAQATREWCGQSIEKCGWYEVLLQWKSEFSKVFLTGVRKDLTWYRIPVPVSLVVDSFECLGCLLKLDRSLRSDLLLLKHSAQAPGCGIAQSQVGATRWRHTVQRASKRLSRYILVTRKTASVTSHSKDSGHKVASYQIRHQSISEHHCGSARWLSQSWMVV